MKAAPADAAVLAFLVCILAAVNISATTFVVTKTEDTNDGVCDADCSLREAVTAANADDTIVFSSLFNSPQFIALSLGGISITRSLAIVGPGPDLVEIRGNGSQIFGISAAVAMSGLTLTGGYARESGGAIWASGPSLNLMNMVIAHNTALSPGAVVPGRGGGIASYGILTITNSTIWDNVAASFPPYPTGLGGGIWAAGRAYILNCSIINNASSQGSGIYGGEIYLTNSTISGNSGGAASAGVYTYGTLTLTNSTIANNRGGVFNAGTVVARNSIIAGNVPAYDFWGTVVSEGNNLIGNTDGSSGWIASDLQNVDPRLGPLGYNGGPTLNHPIAPNSPAKDAGNNALARDPFNNSMLIYDQRGTGFSRIVGSNVDIGAFEANWSTVPVTVGGRVTTLNGRGIPNVRLTLTDGTVTYYAQTNPFGYYRFANLIPGIYTIAVTHKYYRFNSPQVVTVDQNRNDLNFMQLN